MEPLHATLLTPCWSVWGLFLAFAVVGCEQMTDAKAADQRGQRNASVEIFVSDAFDTDESAWQAVRGASASLESGGVHQGALRVNVPQRGAGAERALKVSGSAGVKMAYHMKASRLPSVGINVFDAAASDNTTAYGYRNLRDEEWTPVLYHLDRFHYNSQGSGFVRPNTNYVSVRFFVLQPPSGGGAFLLDNFVVYRGDDTQPPQQVEGLTANVSGGGVQLSWKAAQDDVAVLGYVISRASRDADFRKIGESTEATYVDRTAADGEQTYRVCAVDFEENLGPWSTPVAATATSAPGVSSAATDPHQTDRVLYREKVRQVHERGRGRVRKGHVTLYGDSLTGATLYQHAVRSAVLKQTVDAFGFAGRKTAFARERIDEILKDQNPEFMFVLFGTNNVKTGGAIEAAMQDLRAVVAACDANGTVAILGTIPPRGFEDAASAPEAAYNARLIELARELRTPVAYIFESVQSSGARRNFLAADGVHWTAQGMEVAGRAWGRAFQNVRFVLRDQP